MSEFCGAPEFPDIGGADLTELVRTASLLRNGYNGKINVFGDAQQDTSLGNSF